MAGRRTNSGAAASAASGQIAHLSIQQQQHIDDFLTTSPTSAQIEDFFSGIEFTDPEFAQYHPLYALPLKDVLKEFYNIDILSIRRSQRQQDRLIQQSQEQTQPQTEAPLPSNPIHNKNGLVRRFGIAIKVGSAAFINTLKQKPVAAQPQQPAAAQPQQPAATPIQQQQAVEPPPPAYSVFDPLLERLPPRYEAGTRSVPATAPALPTPAAAAFSPRLATPALAPARAAPTAAMYPERRAPQERLDSSKERKLLRACANNLGAEISCIFTRSTIEANFTKEQTNLNTYLTQTIGLTDGDFEKTVELQDQDTFNKPASIVTVFKFLNTRRDEAYQRVKAQNASKKIQILRPSEIQSNLTANVPTARTTRPE